jgi:hypothetical protein
MTRAGVTCWPWTKLPQTTRFLDTALELQFSQRLCKEAQSKKDMYSSLCPPRFLSDIMACGIGSLQSGEHRQRRCSLLGVRARGSCGTRWHSRDAVMAPTVSCQAFSPP